MKKLVLSQEGSFHQAYQSRLKKYRIKKEFVSLVEIGFLSLGIMFCILMFLIYVNRSSTEGYFLRRANNQLNETNFKHEIVKTTILDLKRINRDKLNNSDLYGPSMNLIDANIEFITLPH